MANEKLSHEYIRGLVEGEGSFSFHTLDRLIERLDGSIIKVRRPVFVIRMHERDEFLLELMRKTMGLHEPLYWQRAYPGPQKLNASPTVTLISRSTEELRNITIPFFYKRLRGNKGLQFAQWLIKMGSEEMSSDSHYLHHLYKKGFFDK